MRRSTIMIAVTLFLCAATAFGQVTLLKPADKAEVSSPPRLSWSGTESPTWIDVDVQNTPVSGWEEGLEYVSGDWACDGTISVNVNCDDFSNNTHNVYELGDNGFIEHCP